MILNKPLEQEEIQLTPVRKTFDTDRARVLRVYGGIFPDNIHQFAERIVKKYKPRTNYAK
jgi:hypothetical protein